MLGGMDTPPPLEPLPEDWTRALAVVAHPDDMEFGSAAAVARWTGQGKEVVYCMVTSGEAGIDAMEPEECRRVREAEEIESARIVGVETVEFLHQPDGILEYGVPLRREIAAVVRKHRPEIVITGFFGERWGGRMLNQADHIATGRAVLDAVRDAGNRWVFPEQLVDGVEPWGRTLLGTGSTPPTPSTRAWSRCGRTRRTSRGWGGRTGTPGSSSRASAGRSGSGWAWRSGPRSRCSR
jgi:LmbE family N-acetylglucosaminyl deacetylase